MNNQTNIYFTTINADNTCIEKEITDFIVSDNNIAKDICNSVDKYKFLINNLSIDSKVVSFMIKIIMNTKIIYNQMFNLKNKDNIVTPTNNTVFVYNETLEIFTKLWIYIPKTIFDFLDKVVEPIIEQTVELQLICEKPIEVQNIEKPIEVQNIEKPVEVQPFFEKSVEVQNIEKSVEAQIINKPVEAQIINKQDDVQQLKEKLIEQQIKEEDIYLDMPGLVKLEEPTIVISD
jgi:hypothetical protein